MSDSSWHIQLDTPKIDDILRGLIGSVSEILEDNHDSPAWEPTFDDDDDIPEDPDGIIDHIRGLRIPSLSSRFVDEPPMTLYRLGTFPEQPNLKLRVENLFNGQDSFLVNSSGTGKTRLIYEGLCMHWGLYFTAANDSMRLGFEDLDHAIKNLELRREFNTVIRLASDPEGPKHNLRLAHREFSTVLLVRLLIFKAFLTAAAASSQSDKHKAIWLKMQLAIPFPGMRIPFTDLSEHIKSRNVDDHVIDDAISGVLSEICALRVTHGQRLFITLDEANVASHSLDRAFVDDEGNHYPVLKVILRIWIGHLKNYPFTFVVAGTEIPSNLFDDDTEWGEWRWTSDTGGFDDRASQRAYIRQFLPSNLDSSDEGQMLIDRIWLWLRGRHRSTAAFISVLLEERFNNPQLLLDSYIHTVTGGYWPQDSMSHANEALDLCFRPINYTLFDRDKKLACRLHEAVIYSLLQVHGHTELSDDAIDIVTNTFGRFMTPDFSSIIINEPWMIAGIVRWFRKSSTSVIDVGYLADRIFTPEISSNHIHALMAAGLAAVFDREGGQRLVDVFSHQNFQDLEITGEIVFNTIVSGDVQERAFKYSSDFSQKLATWTYNMKETLAWIENRDTPFCIFCTDNKTSTLLFTIKTSNGERFWAFLRMVLPFTENDKVAREAKSSANALLPSNLLQPLHGKKSAASVTRSLQKVSAPESFVGTSGVLRVVGVFAHDGEALDFRSSKVSRVSVLNTETICNATRGYGTDELAKRVVSHAIINDSMAKRKINAGINEDEASVQPKRPRPTASSGRRKMTTRADAKRKKSNTSTTKNKARGNGRR